MAKAEHERREDLRKPPPRPLLVEYPELTPRIRDISPSGALIEEQRPLRPGRVFKLRILDPAGSPFEIKAMVRRNIPDVGMTVEFLEMDEETRRRLRRLLSVTEKTEVSLE